MVSHPLYRNRCEAGRILAEYLGARADLADAIVIGLARGGVPVADQVAQMLGVALDVVVVRKVWLPDQPGIPMGAVAEGCVAVIDREFVTTAEITEAEVNAATEREHREIERVGARFRGAGVPSVRDRTVLLVDDGMRTGYSMRAAVAALRRFNPRRIAVAVPIGARPACKALASEVDELICPFHPSACRPVGEWYGDFTPPTDEDVVKRLSRSPFARPSASAPPNSRSGKR